ncbi:hypothetical protein [Roseivirga misakiensis]|uniref:Uncharacterized protein n=1 Tax=Roseivirga misakiensis TaxID=1563681 RepID=A0A1E5T333_9BACT|nr:hypothetical protein [Roseivirga misakiensis]OEK05782.1 hypothetical protein BFP71_06590 [Roseivirga misakiensis]
MILDLDPKNVKRTIFIISVIIAAYTSSFINNPSIGTYWQTLIQLAIFGSFGLSTKFIVKSLLGEDTWFRRILLGVHDIYGFWVDCIKDQNGEVVYVCMNEIKFIDKYPYVLCYSSRYNLDGNKVEDIILDDWKFIGDSRYELKNGVIIFSSRGDCRNSFTFKFNINEEPVVCDGYKITNSYNISELKSDKNSRKMEAKLIRDYIENFRTQS